MKKRSKIIKNELQSEASIHLQVCQWLKMQYPDTIWTSEASGQRLTIGQALKARKLRSGNGLPDLIILEPRGQYHGLCIELKKDDPYKKNGELKADAHLKEQDKTLNRLSQKGYYAEFATGFEEAKNLIEQYLKHDK